MSENLSERSEMSSADEAAQLVQFVAEPRHVGDSVKAAIGRSSRALHWTYSRTRDVWYRNARRIDAAEMDRLREEAAEREHRLAVKNLLALRSQLAATDPDFHQHTIEHLERALCSMGVALAAEESQKLLDGR